jgi:hypothetical protein
MRNLVIFKQLFGTSNISLIFALFTLTSLLYVQQSSTRGVPVHKLRDLRYPSPRLVPWGRRIRSTGSEGHQQHQHQPAYTINRPAHCGQNETLYIDCFLCGKVTDEALIYRWCCERETATVRFCTQLLL